MDLKLCFDSTTLTKECIEQSLWCRLGKTLIKGYGNLIKKKKKKILVAAELLCRAHGKADLVLLPPSGSARVDRSQSPVSVVTHAELCVPDKSRCCGPAVPRSCCLNWLDGPPRYEPRHLARADRGPWKWPQPAEKNAVCRKQSSWLSVPPPTKSTTVQTAHLLD